MPTTKPGPDQLKQFADLVLRLRTIQKASGIGYKTTVAKVDASRLELEVDTEIARILSTP
jgi:hypothetical protein